MFFYSYSIAVNKNSFVSYHTRFSKSGIVWKLHFIWAIQDCELEAVDNFFDLHCGYLRKGGSDKVKQEIFNKMLPFSNVSGKYLEVKILHSCPFLFLFFSMWTVMLDTIVTIESFFELPNGCHMRSGGFNKPSITSL